MRDPYTGIGLKEEEIPAHINQFFTDIGPNLARGNKEPWVYQGRINHQVVGDISTNREEVTKLCKEINTMKSSGFEKLSSKVCKDAFLVLIDQLVHVFNCSLMSTTFPTNWKSAKIVPLFKGGAYAMFVTTDLCHFYHCQESCWRE